MSDTPYLHLQQVGQGAGPVGETHNMIRGAGEEGVLLESRKGGCSYEPPASETGSREEVCPWSISGSLGRLQ